MIAKGYIWFRLGKDGLEYQTVPVENLIKKQPQVLQELTAEFHRKQLTVKEYAMMSGIEFLDTVKDKAIINEDGTLCEVLVDGYKSNLGLASKYFNQGAFLVSEDVWEDLCKNHDIKVNWANK